MFTVKGLAGAGGQAILKAVVIGREEFVVEEHSIENPEAEIERFEAIRHDYILELQALYHEVHSSIGEEAANIIKAYAAIASDDHFFKKPLAEAAKNKTNPDWTLELEKRRILDRFSKIEDNYLRERATDISNVCDELIRRMNGIQSRPILAAREPFLVVAHDLSPEDTVRFDKRLLGGFVSERGGITSHAVILAKTLGIPAVVGVKDVTRQISEGQTVYINGDEGYIIVDPDEEMIAAFDESKTEQLSRKEDYLKASRMPAFTMDGRHISVCVNSGDADSINTFDASLCDGIGLFRTEFLFMQEGAYPTESQQYETYRTVAEKAEGKSVVIRTLDIGGDKHLDYMNLPHEDNPFLGFRAIRISLDRPDVFQTQLRAILRASHYGQLKIMFPMIVTAEELMQARDCLEEAKQALRAEGIPFNEKIPVGIMIETPAAVFISDILAKKVDFFSIGTNDLIQYTTATDRMNEKVQYLYDPLNLSVLRAIKQTIDTADRLGIEIAMCGEMASDEEVLPLLLGLGLTELSIAPSQVGRVKHQIGQYRMSDLEKLAEELMISETIESVRGRLAEFKKTNRLS